MFPPLSFVSFKDICTTFKDIEKRANFGNSKVINVLVGALHGPMLDLRIEYSAMIGQHYSTLNFNEKQKLSQTGSPIFLTSAVFPGSLIWQSFGVWEIKNIYR